MCTHTQIVSEKQLIRVGILCDMKVKLFLSQVYLVKDSNPGSLTEGVLLAIGGRYDYLLHHMWSLEHVGYTARLLLVTFYSLQDVSEYLKNKNKNGF